MSMKIFKLIVIAGILGTLIDMGATLVRAVANARYTSVPITSTVVNNVVSLNTEVIINTVPVSTDVPPPTIDYLATSEVYKDEAQRAIETANEAAAMNAQATALHEQVELANSQLTAAVLEQEFIQNSWTVTAALTSIPLTSTAQSMSNTLASAAITATYQAPQLAQQLISVEYQKKYGDRERLASIMFQWAGIFFMVGLIVFMFMRWRQEERMLQSIPVPAVEVPVTIDHPIENFAGFRPARLVVPILPDQLSIISEAITQGIHTLAINQWEQATTKIGKPVIINFRNWLTMDRETPFVRVLFDGQMIPETALLEFMLEWLEYGELPASYSFLYEPSPTPDLETPDSGKTTVIPNHGYEIIRVNNP